jgi:carbonic anhydrase
MKSKKIYFAFFIAATTFWSCNSKDAAPGAGDSAKETSAKSIVGSTVNCACADILQSPIKIYGDSAVLAPSLEISFRANPTPMDLKHDGHAYKIVPRDPANNFNYVSFNKKVYTFKAFHFHHQSEHWIDCVRSPMEMHIVYENKITGANVVVGLLIESGMYPNTSLNGVFAQFPASGSIPGDVNLTDLIKFSKSDLYYTYVGSLTTKPFTEGVAWIVFRKKLVLTDMQIAKFVHNEPDTARSTFPINNRVVFKDK